MPVTLEPERAEIARKQAVKIELLQKYGEYGAYSDKCLKELDAILVRYQYKEKSETINKELIMKLFRELTKFS